MGIIAGLQAVKAVEKIKKGETADLSIAQITDLIVNLSDAKKICQSNNLKKYSSCSVN